MSFNLLLDSSLAKLQTGGERNVSHDFTLNFQPPIYLGSGNYKASLNKLITMSYSWYNIDDTFDNNKIRWRKKSEEWQTLTFPNGMYDYSGINSFLQSQTGKVKLEDKDSNFIFAELLGYEKKILTGEKNYVGTIVLNITRSVDWVFLHCDLITRRANDAPSDVLYSFSTTGLQVSYPFQKEPYRLEWHPVNKSEINAIRIWVTDGRNNLLDLNGIDVAVSIMIEKE